MCGVEGGTGGAVPFYPTIPDTPPQIQARPSGALVGERAEKMACSYLVHTQSTPCSQATAFGAWVGELAEKMEAFGILAKGLMRRSRGVSGGARR